MINAKRAIFLQVSAVDQDVDVGVQMVVVVRDAKNL